MMFKCQKFEEDIRFMLLRNRIIYVAFASIELQAYNWNRSKIKYKIWTSFLPIPRFQFYACKRKKNVFIFFRGTFQANSELPNILSQWFKYVASLDS